MDDDESPWLDLWGQPAALVVYVTEPVELGHLLGPDGDVIFTVYDRDWVPFGFQPPGRGT